MTILSFILFSQFFVSANSDLQNIRQRVVQTFGADCNVSAADDEAKVYSIRYQNGEDSFSGQLYEILCMSAAYNQAYVYYLKDDWQTKLLTFAEPVVDADGKVIGYSSSTFLFNSYFDEASLKIQFYSKWRGLGDASSSGEYHLHGGQFLLKKFLVDNTFDGVINPKLVIDL